MINRVKRIALYAIFPYACLGLLAYTGYETLNDFHSGLRYLCTGATMVQRRST